MRKRFKHFILSSSYGVARIGLGLLLHPYQTVQSVVEAGAFFWMTLFPSLVLAFLVVNWRIWLFPILTYTFECQPVYPFVCQLVDLLGRWVAFFCAYWQILVLYLYFRFSVAFKNA